VTSTVLQAFEAEARALDAVLDGLTEADYARSTNCPPWTVKDIVVHVAQGLSEHRAAVAATAKPLTADTSDYYRRAERKTAEYHDRIADHAQRESAELPDGATAARLLRERWRATVSTLQDLDMSEHLETRVGVVTRDDLLATRVIAHAAHGLDLAISLEAKPWTTQAALDLMRPVYVSLLGAEPPAELGWDDQTFFACATGRRSLDDGERAILADRADTFPLLS
jgi:uncharacterized protein (TIGR03083 family)